MTKASNILLADDDKDDCLFFVLALKQLPLATSFATVNDGEQLMQYLEKVSTHLPDVIFLDLNMPRKTGYECLIEIKSHSLFKHIPVVILSTSYDDEKANHLHNNGAHYYICKPPDIASLTNAVHSALLLIQENNAQPSKKDFVITKLRATLEIIRR